jgi:hypothetical protein
MKSKKRYFPYEQFEADINQWFRGGGAEKAILRSAWSKMKGQIVVSAGVDYGLRPNSTAAQRAEALSKSWEDVYIAFKGYGDNIWTGFLLQLWHYVPNKQRDSLRQAIQDACDRVDAYYTEHGIRRRYLEKYWTARVRSQPSDFQEPTALPISGKPLRDWAGSEGVDYETFEQVMHEMEVREQSRRALAVQNAPKTKPPAAGPNVIQFPTKRKS